MKRSIVWPVWAVMTVIPVAEGIMKRQKGEPK